MREFGSRIWTSVGNDPKCMADTAKFHNDQFIWSFCWREILNRQTEKEKKTRTTYYISTWRVKMKIKLTMRNIFGSHCVNISHVCRWYVLKPCCCEVTFTDQSDSLVYSNKCRHMTSKRSINRIV